MKKAAIMFIHAFIIWVLCGMTIAVGRSLMSMNLTLIIHAIGAPLFAWGISTIYYKKFNYTTPIQTAYIFLLLVMALDAGVVAPFFEKSFKMFHSVLGTWIPFGLIFISTYITGLFVIKPVLGLSNVKKG